MQQSRLEKFFSKKNSSSSSSSTIDFIEPTSQQQSNKRSINTDRTINKKLKRTQSEISINEDNGSSNENTFSLNRFYLDKFLIILSSLLEYHQHLFHDHELKFFQNFQNLSGRIFVFSNESLVNILRSVITNHLRSIINAALQMASTIDDQL